MKLTRGFGDIRIAISREEVAQEDKKVWLYFLIAVFCVLVYKTFFSFFGIDFPDDGIWVSIQAVILDYPEKSFWMTYLTDAVGGLWLEVSPIKPWLWWWRFGDCILFALSAGFSLLVLRRIVPTRIACFSVILSSILSEHFPRGIGYYSFPAFLSIVWLYMITRYLESPLEKNRNLWVFFIGVMNGLLIACRFPLLLIAGIPLVLWLLHGLRTKDFNASYFARKFFLWGAGLILTYMTILAWCYHVGVRINLFSMDEIAFVDHFGSLKFYVEEIMKGLPWGVLIVTSCALINSFRQDKKITWIATLFIYSTCIFIMGQILSSFPEPGASKPLIRFYRVLVGFSGFSFILILFFGHRKLSMNQWLVLVAMIISFFMFPIGSGGAFQRITCLLAPVFGYLIALMFLNAKGFFKYPFFHSLWVSCLILIVAFNFRVVWRDKPVVELTKSFSSPSLKWVYSFPLRVEVVDGLLNALAKRTQKGDEILVVNLAPMIHFLSGTLPWMDTPAPFFYKDEIFISKFEKELAEKGNPRFIVIPRRCFGYFNWPEVAGQCPKIFDVKLSYVENFMKQKEYKRVYKNELFDLYGVEFYHQRYQGYESGVTAVRQNMSRFMSKS
jgi:hypothetical protein